MIETLPCRGRALADNLAADGVLAAAWNRYAKTDAPTFEADIKTIVGKPASC